MLSSLSSLRRNSLLFRNSATILGVTLSSDLTWNGHVPEAIKKANKRFYYTPNAVSGQDEPNLAL